MVVGLEEGLHLIISVEVEWVVGELNLLVSLDELEAFDNKGDFDTGV